MTDTFEITKELSDYFFDKQTQAAVDFVSKSSASTWLELSVNEFGKSKIHEGYKNYSDAWLYSKKVQKDLFDFMAQVWALSWGKLISEQFSDNLQPENFEAIEEIYKEEVWSREFSFKTGADYDELWLYCELLREDKKPPKISLQLSLGNDGDYKMLKLTCPDNWNRYEEEDDNYVFRNLTFDVKDKQVEISNMSGAIAEMKEFFRKEVFKV